MKFLKIIITTMILLASVASATALPAISFNRDISGRDLYSLVDWKGLNLTGDINMTGDIRVTGGIYQNGTLLGTSSGSGTITTVQAGNSFITVQNGTVANVSFSTSAGDARYLLNSGDTASGDYSITGNITLPAGNVSLQRGNLNVTGLVTFTNPTNSTDRSAKGVILRGQKPFGSTAINWWAHPTSNDLDYWIGQYTGHGPEAGQPFFEMAFYVRDDDTNASFNFMKIVSHTPNGNAPLLLGSGTGISRVNGELITIGDMRYFNQTDNSVKFARYIKFNNSFGVIWEDTGGTDRTNLLLDSSNDFIIRNEAAFANSPRIVLRTRNSAETMTTRIRVDSGDTPDVGIFNANLNLNSNDITGVDKIFAADWTNVSITESQISDLAHTTDTNNFTTSASFSGFSTKTLTLAQQSGPSITGTFTDNTCNASGACSALTVTESQISDFGSYLPLSGGTVTGATSFTGTDTDVTVSQDGAASRSNNLIMTDGTRTWWIRINSQNLEFRDNTGGFVPFEIEGGITQNALLWLDNTNRVGINTSTPSYALDVVGIVRTTKKFIGAIDHSNITNFPTGCTGDNYFTEDEDGGIRYCGQVNLSASFGGTTLNLTHLASSGTWSVNNGAAYTVNQTPLIQSGLAGMVFGSDPNTDRAIFWGYNANNNAVFEITARDYTSTPTESFNVTLNPIASFKAQNSFHLEPRATAPSANLELGDVYVDTSAAYCWYNGTAWQKVSGAGTCS